MRKGTERTVFLNLVVEEVEMQYPDEVHRWVAEKNYLRLAEYLRPRYGVVEFANEIQKLTGLRLSFIHDLIAWYYYDVEASQERKLATIVGWDDQNEAFLEMVMRIQSGEE